MKKLLTFVIIFSLLFALKGDENATNKSPASPLFNVIESYYTNIENNLRIMSYNLLSHELGFDGVSSDERKAGIITLINAVNPHILCLQEMSSDYYISLNKETSLDFISPVNYLLSRSMTVLMYNPEHITLIEHGSVAYKYSTNPRLRCYTWGIFEEKKSNRLFMVVNTHLNLYKQATAYPLLQATELIDFCNKKSDEYNCPIYISGDFNSTHNNDISNDCAVYDYISLYYNDSKENTEIKTHGEGKALYSPISDYIFCSDSVKIKSYTLLSQPELNTLSDHYPIFIDSSLNTS